MQIDLAIIGSGPAALTAAIYAARAELSVTIFERNKIGGALTEIANLGNFPGFIGSGMELAKNLRHQAESCGAKIKYGYVEKVSQQEKNFVLAVDGETVLARSVLLATGSEPIPLNFAPIAPVSYCALCDAPLYRDKNVLVIGGGNSAVGESLMLAEIVKNLTIMTHSELKAEQSRINQLKTHSNVKIIEHTEPNVENTNGYDGIFVYIGKRPATALLSQEYLDDKGYAKTSLDNHALFPGFFAAGDVCTHSIKQAVTAAADGAEAAIEIIKYLQGAHGNK